MKITINGSPKELIELVRALDETAPEAKKAYFPPLLTEIAENENTNLFFGDAHGQTGDEIAETIRRNRETISVIKKMNEVAKQRKENAPQVEAAERKKNQEYFEKQMELLSRASKDCLREITLYQCLPALTQAMIELHQCICPDR